MQTLIKDGHVIDPANKIDGSFDILINNGKIEAVLPKEKSSTGKIKDV